MRKILNKIQKTIIIKIKRIKLMINKIIKTQKRLVKVQLIKVKLT
jgi:hypothetical protein